MFDCPIHGLESSVYCFRAFDEFYVNRWKRFEFKEIEIKDEEKKFALKRLQENWKILEEDYLR